jgi:hypothetical protein
MSDLMLGGVAYVESLLRRAGEELGKGRGKGIGGEKEWPFSAGRDVVTRWVEDVLLGKVREKKLTYSGEECTMRKSDTEAGKDGLPKLVLFSTSSGEEKKGLCLEEDLERRRRVKRGPFPFPFSFEGEKASPPIVVYSSILLSEVCSSILEEENKGEREKKACLVVPQGKEVDSFSRRVDEEGFFFVLLSEEEEGNEDQQAGRWRVYLSTSCSLLHVGFFSL